MKSNLMHKTLKNPREKDQSAPNTKSKRLVLQENLERAINDRGMTNQGVSISAGLGKDFIRDFVEGNKDDLGILAMVQIAEVLKLSVGDLLSDLPLGMPHSWLQCDRVEDVLQRMHRAKDGLIISHCLEAYLQPVEMIQMCERARLDIDVGDEELISVWNKWITSYREKAVRLRTRTRSKLGQPGFHRLIVPADLFEREGRRCNAPSEVIADWMQQSAHQIKKYSQVTAVAFVQPEDWKSVEDLIRQQTGLVSWDKLSIADDEFVYIRPTREVYVTGEEAETARKIRQGIETLLKDVIRQNDRFPAGKSSTPEQRKYWGEATEVWLRGQAALVAKEAK